MVPSDGDRRVAIAAQAPSEAPAVDHTVAFDGRAEVEIADRRPAEPSRRRLDPVADHLKENALAYKCLVWDDEQSPEVTALTSVFAALELIDGAHEAGAVGANDGLPCAPSFLDDAGVIGGTRPLVIAKLLHLVYANSADSAKKTASI
jgi:hypothetical protein